MADIPPLSPDDSLWQWHTNKTPTQVPGHPRGGTPTGDDFRGFALCETFQRGRLPMDQFVRGDNRFLHPIGFNIKELVRPTDLGYFRLGADDPPRKIEYLGHEMGLRAAGKQIISPRDGDQIHVWDYTERGVQGRLMVMCKDGQLLTEDRGLGDGRPELMCAAEECLAAGELRTTSKTREAQLAQGKHAHQAGLFAPPSRPRPVPVPAAFRDLGFGS